MVKLLLSSNHESRPSVEVIVHHPTVICNYEANAKPFDSKLHNGNGDATYRPSNLINPVTYSEIVEKLESDYQRIELASNEDIYNRKLMNRMKLLREKEFILKAREDTLKTREILLKTKETTLEHKQQQIEKREREIAALQRGTDKQAKSIPANRVKENRKSKIDVNLDSTACSADPGDTSVMPTAVKLDPEKIIKPAYFQKNCPTFSHLPESKVRPSKCENEISRQPFLFVHNSNVIRAKHKSNPVAKKYHNLVSKR